MYALVIAKRGSKDIFNIYYSLFSTKKDIELLNDTAEELLKAAESLKTWQRSKYGASIRFCDDHTLVGVREIWETYCVKNRSDSQHAANLNAFKDEITRIHQYRQEFLGSGIVLTAMRAAAPLSVYAASDIGHLHDEFWRPTVSSPDLVAPNPTFSSGRKGAGTLHYATDPLNGFQFGAAYTPVLGDTTPRAAPRTQAQQAKVMIYVKQQFSEWVESFVKRVEAGKLVVRIVYGDALSVAHTLHNRVSRTSKTSVNLYRHPHRPHAMNLNYDGPAQYHVIDTSNLADSLGAINLLSACAGLLNRLPTSSLYLETLVKKEKNLQTMAQELLCGDMVTIAQLFALSPVQHWTNSTVSSPNEAFNSSLLAMLDTAKDAKSPDGQMFYRLNLKPSMGDHETPLSFTESQLGGLLYKTYLNMFQNEDWQRSFSDMGNGDPMRVINKLAQPRYHRGSLAAFLNQVRYQVSTDWSLVMESFVNFVKNDRRLLIGANYLQELYVYLHLFDLYRAPSIARPLQLAEDNLASQTLARNLRAWASVPSILRITLIVPRNKLSIFPSLYTFKSGFGTPNVHCSITAAAGHDSHLGSRQDIFGGVNLSFGQISCHGVRDAEDSAVSIEHDKSGWSGSSPLIVSFWAPTSLIMHDSDTATIAFALQATPAATHSYAKHLGTELKVFETLLTDRENVIITRNPANLLDQPSLSRPLARKSTMPHGDRYKLARSIHARLDDASNLAELTGRLDVTDENLQKSLASKAAVSIHRIDSFTIALHIGDVRHSSGISMKFPVPIDFTKHKLRIARTSSYIEVVAPVMTREALDRAADLIALCSLQDGIPAILGMPSLRLVAQPTLDHMRSTDIEWLTPHTSIMWSGRERKIRDEHMGKSFTPNARLNLKESLFSIIMQYTGLQGRSAKIFGLNNANNGGNQILIIPIAMKLDTGQLTVVFECAVVPLTVKVVRQLHSCFQAWMNTGIPLCNVQVDDSELEVWKYLLPAYAERCRDWPHKAKCEYRSSGKIPVTTAWGESPICSCGLGKIDSSLLRGIPRADLIAKYAVRAAISPCYSVPFVELPFDPAVHKEQGARLDPNGCAFCAKANAKDGGPLKKCSGCKIVGYCSRDCQRGHWKAHKVTCGR